MRRDPKEERTNEWMNDYTSGRVEGCGDEDMRNELNQKRCAQINRAFLPKPSTASATKVSTHATDAPDRSCIRGRTPSALRLGNGVL